MSMRRINRMINHVYVYLGTCNVYLPDRMAGSVSEVDICNLAYEGRLELVRASLEKNPEAIKTQDSSKRSALHWACSSGKDDVVNLLVSKGAEVRLLIIVHRYERHFDLSRELAHTKKKRALIFVVQQ